MPQNKCQNNRVHKCQTCGRWGCKSRNHSQHRPTNRPQAHVTAFDNEIFDGPNSQAQGAGPTTVNNHPGFQEMFDQHMERLISSCMEQVDGQHQASASCSGTQPLSQQAPDLAPLLGTARNYGMPAVTALPNHLSISKLQLEKKNILWTPITSAGVSLRLPLDTCCSLSLVSQAHADIICQKYPDIQFTKLITPLPVAVVTPDSQLMAIGMLRVPVVWETGKLCTFSMLVVPKQVWPILFGQNHLDMIGAQTDHTKRTVKFTDPDLNFTVSCPNENPVDMYPRLGNPCSISPGCVFGGTINQKHSRFTSQC